MKSGIRPYKWQDKRDRDYHKSYGSVMPPQFPAEFSVDAGLWMPNQEETLTYAIPGFDNLTVPAMPYGCTEWGAADACVDGTKKLYNPMDLENIVHANARGGVDVKETLDACLQPDPLRPWKKRLGWASGYYNVKRINGADWYDSFRIALLSLHEENRPILIGIPWLHSYNNSENGVATGDIAQALKDNTYTWHLASFKGWDGRGAKIKPWQGTNYGDKGWVYFNRATINQLLDVPGSCAFALPVKDPEQVATIDLNYVQWFVSLILNVWASFTKPSEPSAVLNHTT